MSPLNTRRDGKTWWQIAYQGWIPPQNEGVLSGESFSRYLVWYIVVNNYCDSCINVLLFLYVLCWIWWYWRDVLVLRYNSREWQLGDGISWSDKQWTVQFWSYDLWFDQWSFHQRCLHVNVSSSSRLVLWRCLADSVLASSSAGRCDVPRLTVEYC